MALRPLFLGFNWSSWRKENKLAWALFIQPSPLFLPLFSVREFLLLTPPAFLLSSFRMPSLRYYYSHSSQYSTISQSSIDGMRMNIDRRDTIQKGNGRDDSQDGKGEINISGGNRQQRRSAPRCPQHRDKRGPFRGMNTVIDWNK